MIKYNCSKYKYENRFEKKKILSQSEQEARAIIYADEHAKAYERANNEARLEFINCELEGMKIKGNIRKTDDNGIYVAQFFENNDMILNRINKFCIGSIS